VPWQNQSGTRKHSRRRVYASVHWWATAVK
jgi:hypothetical protein